MSKPRPCPRCEELRAMCSALWEEGEAKIKEAQRVHNQPTLFLDRDQKCRSLLSEAEGMQRAAHRMLELLVSKKTKTEVTGG